MVELTPTLLFIILNIVIATIFILSSFTTPHRKPQLSRGSSFLSRAITSFGRTEPIGSTQHDFDTTPLARTPSLLSRLTPSSFLSLNQTKQSATGPSARSDDSSSFSVSGLNQAKNPSMGPPARPDFSYFSFSDLNQTKETSAGPATMCDPTSCMDQPNKDLTLAENQEEKCEGESRNEAARSESSMGLEMLSFKSDMEVDAKADDFINKFKNQLKLQRLESLLRYRNSAN